MSDSTKEWDILIKNALMFDGLGGAPQEVSVATKDGVFAAIGTDLDEALANEVIDAKGQWLMPGLVDNHTHFDLEVELEPWLPEAVRHGTTTVVMSNCSLGVAFGKQLNPQKPEENPIVDVFARVENIPKSVLEDCVNVIDWENTGDYLDHFDDIPLGPNVAPMVPHTMLRIEVMGLEESISRKPTDAEIKQMAELLQQAMDEGYIGFSTDGLPLHYLANNPHKNVKIPAQHATWKEVKTLLDVVRNNDGVVQTTPNPDNMLVTAGTLIMTSGRLFGKPLRMTATAAMDLNANQRAADGILRFNSLLNSDLVRGDFTFQALSAPFRVYADGVTTPLLEEKPAFRELNACEVEDREGRLKLLNDPSYQQRFRADWMAGKVGFNLARLLRKLHMEPTTFGRNLSEMYIDTCPVSCWQQSNMGEIYDRLEAYQKSGGQSGALNEEEASAFAEFPNPIGDDAEFIMHMLRQYDKQFRWYTTTANERPETLKKLLFHEQTLPGFNDSGAHLTNMAFFDGNLRTLKIALEDSIDKVSVAVKRLTHDPARLFGLDIGTIELGRQADMVIIDPEALRTYDSGANTVMQYREVFQHNQMVNRSDGVVSSVVIAGKLAWDGKEYTAQFGKERFGRALRNRNKQQYLPGKRRAAKQAA
ncbi:MAG TPA: hypothetical protein DCZ03_02140 [Gammaproteobacteria bacterium]|nr:hypothetical protein [Gammaproteobacteria bacterium]